MNQQQNQNEVLISPISGNEYYREMKINQGSEGIVYKGYFIDKGQKRDVAIKISDNMKDDEIQFLDQLSLNNQENLIKYYDVFIKRQPTKMFVSVMELANQNLLDFQHSIEWNKVTDEGKIKLITDIAKGLKQLHQLKFSHRDLKPENILKIGDNWKLCDFGLTKHVVSVMQTTHIGTPYYFSPEIIQFHNNGQDYGNEVDMWAFGCIIYEILTKKVLFNAATYDEVMQNIFQYCKNSVNKDYRNINDPILNDIKDHDLYDLCKQLLIVNSKMRITSEKALEFLLDYQRNGSKKKNTFQPLQINVTSNQEAIAQFGNNRLITPKKSVTSIPFIPSAQLQAPSNPQFNMNQPSKVQNVFQTFDEKSQVNQVNQGNLPNFGKPNNFATLQPNQFQNAQSFQNQKGFQVQNVPQQQTIQPVVENQIKNPVIIRQPQNY